MGIIHAHAANGGGFKAHPPPKNEQPLPRGGRQRLENRGSFLRAHVQADASLFFHQAAENIRGRRQQAGQGRRGQRQRSQGAARPAPERQSQKKNQRPRGQPKACALQGQRHRRKREKP